MLFFTSKASAQASVDWSGEKHYKDTNNCKRWLILIDGGISIPFGALSVLENDPGSLINLSNGGYAEKGTAYTILTKIPFKNSYSGFAISVGYIRNKFDVDDYASNQIQFEQSHSYVQSFTIYNASQSYYNNMAVMAGWIGTFPAHYPADKFSLDLKILAGLFFFYPPQISYTYTETVSAGGYTNISTSTASVKDKNTGGYALEIGIGFNYSIKKNLFLNANFGALVTTQIQTNYSADYVNATVGVGYQLGK